MRLLTNTLAAIMTLSLIQAGDVLAEPAIVTLPGTFPGSGGLARSFAGSDLPPAYPEWPQRSIRSEVVPLPPPGPYMSTAMSGIDAFPANTGGLRDDYGEQQMRSPFFTADMPWPETPKRARPEAWMPESGEYHFVPEEVVHQLESPAPSIRQERQRYQPYPGYPPAPPVRQPYYGYR